MEAFAIRIACTEGGGRMAAVDRLADCLGGEIGALLRREADSVSELRLRCGQKTRLCRLDGTELAGPVLDAAALHRIIRRLCGDSLYAFEEELKQGYFTAQGGLRVGVCGRISVRSGAIQSVSEVSSLCIRIPREIRGCGAALAKLLFGKGLTSALILSPPGMGKTTLLRDLIRIASESGWNVAVADERRELAACWEGIPQMDVGPRTDVMDGCPKALALPLLIRACAPQLLAADEIGDAADAKALLDARRCGAAVLATAHAAGLKDALRRESLAAVLREGVFDRMVLLGPPPGRVRAIYDCVSGEEIEC